jgi:hypothetical protein
MNRYRVAPIKPKLDGSVKLAARRVQFRDSYFCDFSSRLATFLKARLAPASSACASRAASMKRLDCWGSSFGRSFFDMRDSIACNRGKRHFLPRSFNGNSNCTGALTFLGAVRYLIREAPCGRRRTAG